MGTKVGKSRSPGGEAIRPRGNFCSRIGMPLGLENLSPCLFFGAIGNNPTFDFVVDALGQNAFGNKLVF